MENRQIHFREESHCLPTWVCIHILVLIISLLDLVLYRITMIAPHFALIRWHQRAQLSSSDPICIFPIFAWTKVSIQLFNVSEWHVHTLKQQTLLYCCH